VLILAVDTTTPGGSVALLEDESLLGEANVESPATHSARLFRSIDFLLGALAKDIKDVEAFAVAAGPGSFTGIRIGLATAKGIAFATGCALVGVTTLDALALPWSGFPGSVWSVIDARKGRWYAAGYREGRRVTDHFDLAPEDLRARIAAGGVPFLVAGPDAPRFAAGLPGAAVSDLFDPAAVLRAGTERFAREGAAARSLTPLYLRPSEAEIGAGRGP